MLFECRRFGFVEATEAIGVPSELLAFFVVQLGFKSQINESFENRFEIVHGFLRYLFSQQALKKHAWDRVSLLIRLEWTYLLN